MLSGVAFNDIPYASLAISIGFFFSINTLREDFKTSRVTSINSGRTECNVSICCGLVLNVPATDRVVGLKTF